jgi:NAD(P)-dependent dehydrogenase (short-subunit alcohol dehydrogenase family)
MSADMKGKICVITGANSGIGKATAVGLAKMGATIVMICRNAERGEAARKEIIEKTGNESVDLLIADLSSQKAIRNVVEEYKKKYQNLHVLINNAGLVLRKRAVSEDNIEMNFAVNHLAPFLLTNLLLDVLKKSAPSRIINVTSGLHKNATLDFDDLKSEKSYGSYKTYGKSKLALVLFTYELSRRLEGTKVTANVLHPGVIKSNLGRDMSVFSRGFTKIFFKKPEKGAETPIYLASSPEVEGVTGKYFVNKQEAKSAEESYNEEIAKKLWEISEQLTDLKSS